MSTSSHGAPSTQRGSAKMAKPRRGEEDREPSGRADEQTWRLRYIKSGFTAVEKRDRSDKGKFRRIDPERVLEALEQAKASLRPPYAVSALYRVCIENGYLGPRPIAPNTFRRMVKRFGMLKPEADARSERRLAFAKAHANDAWQADTLHGPYAGPQGRKKLTYLIAFIDDASRVLRHGQFFFEESVAALKETLRCGIYKRGLPRSIYMDNGSAYKSQEFAQVCARLGILPCHAPVRDGAAKGKIERFFRTCRDRFLSRQLDLSSLEQLNRQFTQWAEEEYNCAVHATLGIRPIERYALDRRLIKYLPPMEATDEIFMPEQTRTVLADNTFKFGARRWECPRRLHSRKVQVRQDPAAPDSDPIVYYKGERMGPASPLDFHANDRPPRKLREADGKSEALNPKNLNS